MNKTSLLTFCLFFSFSGFAVTFKVLDPCSGSPVLEKQLRSDQTNVGEVTNEFLSQAFNDYVGSPLGVNTVLGTPTGLDALEILSRSQMRSYGWCYSVNGIVPEVYPSNFVLSEKDQSVVWFYGFAFYDSGSWLSQCEPLHLNPHSFICGE